MSQSPELFQPWVSKCTSLSTRNELRQLDATALRLNWLLNSVTQVAAATLGSETPPRCGEAVQVRRLPRYFQTFSCTSNLNPQLLIDVEAGPDLKLGFRHAPPSSTCLQPTQPKTRLRAGADGRFLLEDRHRSSPVCLPRNHARWCNPWLPVHGQRSLTRVRWGWRNKPRCRRAYRALRWAPARLPGPAVN